MRPTLLMAIAVIALTAGAAGATVPAPPTVYLVPLRQHQDRLADLHREIIRLAGLPTPRYDAEARLRASEITRAGTAYLAEARRFSDTVDAFVRGGTRRGLDSEVTRVRSTIGQVLATISSYRSLAGATLSRPTTRAPSVLQQELRAVLADQVARRIPDKLLAEGVRRMVTGESFERVAADAVAQARRQAYASVDGHVRRVTGLGLRDLRDLRRAVRLRANQEVDRIFERLLVNATPNALVVELARRFVYPWLKARLTQLMRPRMSLDRRVQTSFGSLERAARSLNALSPNARLQTVHARWQQAHAALAATRFLVADIKRAGREGVLSGAYGDALSGVERAMRLAETRFLLHKEDLVQSLAADQRELRAMLGDLAYLAAHVSVAPGNTATFAIASVSYPATVKANGARGDLSVRWSGSPVFPVKMVVPPDTCPPGITCTTPAATFQARANPLVFSGAIWCTGAVTKSIRFDYSVFLEDAKGSRTTKRNVDFTCAP